MVERVCFCFADVCNMRCKFCYGYFNGHDVNKQRCFDVVKRCAEIGIKMITFGGGDPFKYEFIYELVEYARLLGMKCSIDTNGIGFNIEKYEQIRTEISILSLPLDGYDANSHDIIRGRKGHYDKVVEILESLNGKAKIRINTVLSKKNYKFIMKMLDTINKYDIYSWSLYEFKPLELGSKNCMDYVMDSGEKVDVLTLRSNAQKNLIIDYSMKDEHIGDHFFVTHDGELYLNDTNCISQYVKMGTIFSDNDLENSVKMLRFNIVKMFRDNKSMQFVNLFNI